VWPARLSRVYRYDAEPLLAAFSGRLRDAVDLDTVRRGLLEAAGRAVEPQHVSLWLREEPRLNSVARSLRIQIGPGERAFPGSVRTQ
jgi:GAF domain-containing protein